MTATPMTRTARLSDAGEIARLTTQLGYELTASHAADRLSRILPRMDQQFWVAEIDSSVVGWVHAARFEFVESGAFVVIGGLVVDKDQRRQGIGRALMQRAEEWTRQQGWSVVRLWSSVIRTEAHQFYERLGYKRVKTQHSFVKSLDGNSEDFKLFMPQV
jgi:GNAT superfamily N-acetyltransferase